ncbi:TPA: ead/Ea22-like family protein [Klebsiella pneumoniae]
MTTDITELTQEAARESGSILIIVAARMARREFFTPLHALCEAGKRVVSTRALRDAVEHAEERMVSQVPKIVDGHDRLTKKLKEAESRNAELVEALEKAQQRNAELEAQNEYIRKRYQQLDLLIGKNILVMQAAIIEWQATGDAKNGLAWIYNTLFGPGELPDEAEKDAQAYFDRKYAPLDEELMALHKWFWEQSEAERAAAGIKVEAE